MYCPVEDDKIDSFKWTIGSMDIDYNYSNSLKNKEINFWLRRSLNM